MQIRLLTSADAILYRALRLEALQTNPNSFISTFEAEKNKSKSSFESELVGVYNPPLFGYWGVFDGEFLIAYIQLFKSYLPKQAHIAFLYNLYVDPKYRRKKIATKLLNHLIKQLKNQTQTERIFLSCNAKNKEALNFYRKSGFKRCGIKAKSIKHQGEYDDEIEMVLEL